MWQKAVVNSVGALSWNFEGLDKTMMERGSRKRSSSARSEKMERAGER
jgi:hypothetical protein